MARDEREGGDWPRWRGPRGDGISHEAAWTCEWPPEGPRQVWQTNVGIGFSSLAVSNGLVYTMGHQKHDPEPPPSDEAQTTETLDPSEPLEEKDRRGTDVVYCLNAETGQTRWTYRYPCLLVDRLHEGGPAATPTLAGEYVYTLSKEGHLCCLDRAGGDLHWKRQLQDDLHVEMPEWGFSSSPLVEEDLVIVDAGRLAAYDAANGQLVWKTVKYDPGYGSAVSFWSDGDEGPVRHVAVLNNQCLLVVRLEDGRTVARRKWTTAYDTSSTTPVVMGDTIFISTGYRRGCMLARLHGNQLEKIYEHKEMCNHINTCVAWDGHLYGFNGNSHRSRVVTLTCMEWETGEVKWAQRGLGCGSLMIAGGRLVCLADDGELVVVEASSEEYRELARARILEGRCWTTPVLVDGQLFARNSGGDLVCVDLSR